MHLNRNEWKLIAFDYLTFEGVLQNWVKYYSH